MFRRALVGFLAALLAACTAGEPYRRPDLPLPPVWRGPDAASLASSVDGAAWWQAFDNPELQRLEALALAANPDLQIAISRMLAARAGVAIAQAQKSVQVNFGAAPVDAIAVSAANRKSGLYGLAFSARYEIDFWGRIARSIDAAGAAHEASVFDAGTIQIGLQTQVARTYFKVRELDELAALQTQRLLLLRDKQTLAQLRQSAGRTNLEPVATAAAESSAAETLLAQQQSERAQAILQLALLLGQTPESLDIAVAPLRTRVRLPPLPAALPASIIERRPDILAAEQRLREAHADVGVARAALLPTISLDAELGVVSGPLSAPLRGSRGLFGIGPELDYPIIDGGRRDAELDARQQARNAAVAEYRKAVLVALGDVESALLTREAARQQGERLTLAEKQDAVSAARLEAALTAGRSSRLATLVSKDRALDRAAAAVSNYRDQLDAALALFAALGGGWTVAQLPVPD